MDQNLGLKFRKGTQKGESEVRRYDSDENNGQKWYRWHSTVHKPSSISQLLPYPMHILFSYTCKTHSLVHTYASLVYKSLLNIFQSREPKSSFTAPPSGHQSREENQQNASTSRRPGTPELSLSESPASPPLPSFSHALPTITFVYIFISL